MQFLKHFLLIYSILIDSQKAKIYNTEVPTMNLSANLVHAVQIFNSRIKLRVDFNESNVLLFTFNIQLGF